MLEEVAAPDPILRSVLYFQSLGDRWKKLQGSWQHSKEGFAACMSVTRHQGGSEGLVVAPRKRAHVRSLGTPWPEAPV